MADAETAVHAVCRPKNWLSSLLVVDWPLATPPPPPHQHPHSNFAMPSLNGFGNAADQANGASDDQNGYSRPETPAGTMALTEYSVNPDSPPSEQAQARMKQLVPEQFLLPSGYPDVSSRLAGR